MSLEKVDREVLVTAFIKSLTEKPTPEEIEELKIKNRIDEEERKKEFRLNESIENYHKFFEENRFLPLDAIDRTIEDLKPDNPELYGYLQNWKIFGPYGFCICGPVGTGKTYALTTILNLIASTLRDKCYPIYGSIYWNTSSMILEDFRDSFNERESVMDKIEKIQSKRFLFIDDFGAHKVSDFAIEKLISILDYRVNNNLPTFFSTNCKIDQMKTTFGDRIFSRITATSVMVEIKGKDRRLDIHAARLKQLKGEQ